MKDGAAAPVLSGNLVGILCVMGAATAFSINDVVIKLLSGGYPLHQLTFFRSLFGVVFTLAIFVPLEGPYRNLATTRPWFHAMRGLIVNVISTSVKEPIRNLGVSNTIRGAMASWSKTLATELGPSGITVNNVLPGYTRTQRLDQILADRAKATGNTEEKVAEGMLATVPLRRFAEASEIAGVIAFLASPAGGYINGINVPVDGGRTLSL